MNQKNLKLRSVRETRNERMRELLHEVIAEIKPPAEERKKTKKVAKRIRRDVKGALKAMDLPHEVEIHGSYSKGTWLSRETDLDLFVLLKEEVSREYIEKILKKIETSLPYVFRRRYASHPYLRTKIRDIGVDIVPSLQVGEQITAVDRTPEHTSYVRNHLEDIEKDEVRLLKKFLKGISCYGAEIKVGGFSGMACEILVEELESFFSVLSFFKENDEIFLDPTQSWSQEDAFEYFDSQLVVIDPTDRERNLLAALTPKTFSMTQIAAKCFLDNPKREFFFPSSPSFNKRKVKKALKDRAILFIRLHLNEDVPPDTFWGQAKKVEKKVGERLQNDKFDFFASDVWKADGEIHLAIELGRLKKPKKELVVGPPSHIEVENLEAFIEKYRKKVGPWVGHSNRLIAEDTLTLQERKAKTNALKELKRLKLEPSFTKVQVIEDPQEIFKLSERKEQRVKLVEFLERRLPWLY